MINVLYIDYIKEEIGGGHFVLARLANYYENHRQLNIKPYVWLNNYEGFVDKFIDKKVPYHPYEIPASILQLDRTLHLKDLILRIYSIILFWIKFTISLYRFCKAKNIKIVHANNATVFIFSSIPIKLSRAKLVYHLHDALLTPDRGGNINKFALRLIDIFIRYFSDKVIVVSNFVKNTVLELDKSQMVNRKIQVIYNGLDLNSSRKDGFFRNRPVNEKRIRLLSFGTLSERKGFHLGIESASILKHKYSVNLEYKILGEGYYKSDLLKLAKKLGVKEEVQLLGFQENVRTYIKQAYIILIPSVWQDPLPLAVIESMRDQKVVIATRVGGIPEMIEDGITGFLVSLDNAPEEIAEKVVYLLRHPEVAKRVAKNAGRRVREYFNIDRMAEEIRQVYLSVVDRNAYINA